MAISGEFILKVTPEELISRAAEVKSLGEKMKGDFAELEQLVEKTRGYWIGEAGELHRQRYTEQKDDIQRMLNRLMEHPDDLLLISGNYSQAESTNVETAQALPNDLF